jgi:predicted dehydrogenase
MTLRAGLVGCGSLSQRGVLPHLSVADARERIQLVAAVDAVAERAKASAERWNIPHYFDDIHTMLAEVELDVVLVITPIAQHYEHALAAIEAGRHVYVQKAMTVTTAEADALLAARDRMGVKLAAAPGFELFPLVTQLRAVAQEALGPVYAGYTFTMGFGHEHEPIRGQEGTLNAIDPSWYYRAGAGPLPDVTIYSLQLITSMLGPVKRVTALANTRRPERIWRDRRITIEIPDNTVLLMEFASGAIITAIGSDSHGSTRLPWGSVELYGASGTLTITDVNFVSGYPVAFAVSGAQAAEYSLPLNAQPYLSGAHLDIEEPHVYVDIMELVDAIAEDRAPRNSGEQARHVVEIIEAARAAAATGQAQELVTTF